MITLIGSNLNQFGDAGQFETDRSTWGFADWAGIPTVTDTFTATRSSVEKTAGLYSALVVKPSLSDLLILPSRFTKTLDKTYLVRCKVRMPSSNPMLSDGDITLNSSGSNLLSGCTVLENNAIPYSDAIDAWAEVSVKLRCDSVTFPTIRAYLNYTGTAILNGQMYVDEFEIFEYIEAADPDPDPTCDVELDNEDTTVNDETNFNDGDGSIEVGASGVPTLEYSNDGVSWQLSNLFAGLVTGIYVMRVRKQGLESCLKQYPFALNYDPVTHDFTPIVTNESITGLHDGSISISVTGTGGPFQYTKDAGASWQSSNNFTGLAPGIYYVAVRNAAGNSVVKVVTVGAGTVEIDTIFHSKNPVIFARDAAPGWDLLTNYRLYNEVRVEDEADSGVFNTKLKVDLHPDVTGTAIFYIAEAFRGVFSFTPPVYGSNAIARLTDRIKRFRSHSGELQDTEETPLSLEPSTISLVLYGGIDKFHYPWLKFFTTYLPTKKKFLTWAPVSKSVDRTQEDYLNFWLYGNFNALKVRVKAYYDDNTTETEVTITRTSTVYGELYMIPAGPSNSGALLINPAKNLTKYELTLLDQTDTEISETRTYNIVSGRHPLTRYFMFLNSLGSFEVLRFTGQAMVKTSFDREISQRFLPHNYQALDGEFVSYDVNRQKQFDHSSGYISGTFSPEWHEYLEDFMGSPIVFDVTDGSRMPIVILSGDHEMEDQNYKRFIRFQAKAAYDNSSFTPRSI